jgi:hypothetical protein
MKKRSFIALLFILVSCQANAEDIADMPQEQLPQASKALIMQIRNECEQWAAEHGFVKENKRKWVLKCINLALDIEGFRPIKSLD